MISLDINNSKIIGSYKYDVQKYPSDIDVFEIHVFNKESEDKIKNICNNFNKGKKTMFVELKAGIDEIYDIAYQVDLLDDNPSITDKREQLRDKYTIVANFYLSSNSIDIEDYNAIIKAIDNFNSCTVLEVYLIMRKYMILRWTLEEVLQGFKYILGTKEDGSIDYDNPLKIYLSDSLIDHSEVNIECAFVDEEGNINEISNYIIFTNNKKEPYNVPSINDPLYITNLLKRGIYLVSSKCLPENKINLFKAVKKMYSLTRLELLASKEGTKKYDLALEYNIKLASLLESQTNIIYYVYSKLKSLLKIYKSNINDSPNKKWDEYYNKTMKDLKTDINKISKDSIKKMLKDFITSISKSINNVDERNNLVEICDNLLNKIAIIINKQTVKLLKSVNLYNDSDKNNLSLISSYFSKYIPGVLNYKDNVPTLPYKFMNRGEPLYYPKNN